MNGKDPHPLPDNLERRLLNRVNDVEDDEIEQHLRACEHCRGVSTSLEEQIKLIRQSLSHLP